MRFLREIEALREAIRKETAPRQPEYAIVHAIVDPTHVDVRPLKGSTLIRGVQLIGEAVVGEQVKLWWIEKRPYALGRNSALGSVQAAPIVGGGGQGSEGPYAPTPHALDSIHHSGTLNDDQAPQFLKRDGSRSLTGHLSVLSGVTIDGVDLDVHAADPNAHHNRQHSITSASDHTVSGNQYDVVGLINTNTLGILQSSDSPGANVRLLRSTGTGGLTLESLNVNGMVDIGQDLVVRNTAGFGGPYTLFVDTSQNNVGIATTTPDPQFALDVAGPMRAQWYIGPHALQLKNVMFLAHYDGPYPFETNFTGSPDGHLGQTPNNSWGGIIYRPGMFGTKAVQVAEDTKNYMRNPSFEVDTSFVTDYSSGSATGTRALVTEWSAYGSQSYKITKTGGGVNDRWGIRQGVQATSEFVAGDSVTFSVSLKVEQGTTARVYMELNDGTGRNASVLATEDGRYSVTITNLAGTPSFILCYVWIENGNGTVYVDGMQVERKPYATPYCDGSLGTGHTWIGTAHASASTRSAARLAYAVNGALKPAPQPGTVMAWFYTEGLTGNHQYIFHQHGTNQHGASGWVILRITPSGNISGYWGASQVVGTGVTARTWHHAAITYDGTTSRLYLDGKLVNSIVNSGYTPANTMDIGSNAGNQWLNGYIDDVVILSHAADEDEIRAVYESGAPVFAESATLAWRAGQAQLAWANDEGLFAIDRNGNATFAVVGVNGKSWGADTLDTGDVMIGHAGGGFSNVKWDQSSGTLQLRVATTPKITLRSNGNLFIGTDTNNPTTTHLAIFSSAQTYNGEGVGAGDLLIGDNTTGSANILWDKSARQLKFRGGTTTQAYIDTDGSIKAGGGNVTLNAQGLTFNSVAGASYQIWKHSGIEIASQFAYPSGPLGDDSVHEIRSSPKNALTGGSMINLVAIGQTGRVVNLALDARVGKNEIIYSGDLVPNRGNVVPGYIFIPTAKLGHSNWNGDAKASNAGSPTAINIYQFGVPQEAKAVYLRLAIKDSSVGTFLSLGQSTTRMGAVVARTQVANEFIDVSGIVPMDENGQIWYETNGADSVYIEVFGYFI